MITVLTNEVESAITINKSRIKKYENSVYLKGGQNFEIELYNKSDKVLIAEVFIGDQRLDQVILLRPKDHIYLDNWLDQDRSKLVFNKVIDTSFGIDYEMPYKVSINYYKQTPKVFGEIIIKEKEYIPAPYPVTIPWPAPKPWSPYNQPYIYYSSTGNSDGTIPIATGQQTYTNNNASAYSYTASFSTSNTGVIEKDNKVSKETVIENNMTKLDFEDNCFRTDIYKLELKDNKPIEVNEIRKYCVECGRKLKDKFKYCPTCGTKN